MDAEKVISKLLDKTLIKLDGSYQMNEWMNEWQLLKIS